MTIKEAARRCGESEHTIRCYCKEGLFPFAARDKNNIRHYMDLCREGMSTLPERLQIIQNQKAASCMEMKEFQKKIDHLEEKEQFYIKALETNVEDDSCNPFLHTTDHDTN